MFPACIIILMSRGKSIKFTPTLSSALKLTLTISTRFLLTYKSQIKQN